MRREKAGDPRGVARFYLCGSWPLWTDISIVKSNLSTQKTSQHRSKSLQTVPKKHAQIFSLQTHGFAISL